MAGISLGDADVALMDGSKTDSIAKVWRDLKIVAATPAFWAILLSVWAVFTIVLIVFTYEFMKAPYACVAISFMLLVVAALTLVWNSSGGSSPIYIPISAGIIVAVFIATILGLYNYETYAIFPQFYDNSRKYSNVVASEPSAAISDAGKIAFNFQTKVDVGKSAGLISEFGTMYCVAPVYSPVKQPRIEYWAAGINCCTQAGGFTCDAADNPKAGGGIRVFDNNGWFSPSRWQYYQKARLKAEATWQLQSVASPIYIRWVESDNLDYLQNWYASHAVWLIVICSFIAFISSGVLAFILSK